MDANILNSNLQIHPSLGAYPSALFEDAIGKAISSKEKLWGNLNPTNIQICPQNRGKLTEEKIENILLEYPNTRFRLHANVKVLDKSCPIASLSNFSSYKAYFTQVSVISKIIKAKAYTLHAGTNNTKTPMSLLFSFLNKLQDMFDCPVGVEGHYPTKTNYHLSNWDSHREMFEKYNVNYVIDLSHFNIIKNSIGMSEKDFELLRDMISNDRCLEIHVSGNDGIHDSHHLLTEKPWWFNLLKIKAKNAVIFSEGIQNNKRKINP